MADEPDETSIDPSPPPAEKPRQWRVGRIAFHVFLAAWLGVALCNVFKPMPEGTRVRGEIDATPLNQMQFLADVTGADVFGAPIVDQEIFDAMLRVISSAKQYVVVDFFLFNAQRGAGLGAPRRALSA